MFRDSVIRALIVAVLFAPANIIGADRPDTATGANGPSALRFEYIGGFSSDTDVAGPRSACEIVAELFSPDEISKPHPKCQRTLDILAGPAAPETPNDMVRPLKIANDSKQRIIVTDPGAGVVHIFDFRRHRYLRFPTAAANSSAAPAVAVDDTDAIYVTDSEKGRILVYDSQGKFKGHIGDIQGEGLFQRPSSIAIDRIRRYAYVSDPPSHLVFKLDVQGKIVARFGKRRGGGGPGEFRNPTAVAVNKTEVAVLDAGNSRIQVMDFDGRPQREFPITTTSHPRRAEPALAIDDEGRIYLSDPDRSMVQIFNRDGTVIETLTRAGQHGLFGSPAGISLDERGRLFLVDTRKRRVHLFRARSPQAGNKSESQDRQSGVRVAKDEKDPGR